MDAGGRIAGLLGAAGLILTLAGTTPLVAQNTGAIRGTVRSAETNAPVPGAQVSIGALQIGTITNEDGRYSLPAVPAGRHTLSVQTLGFATEQRENVEVTAGATLTMDFQLRTQVLSMSELVVTGVTEATSRAKIPFTVAKVSADAIVVAPKSALGSIQGKVAGVNLVGSAEPGGDASIMLRSPTSIFKSNSPLIVVDGAILTGSIADISPQDIESIEVVKGAAGASLYGSRASAGVIQIRTNRGSQITEGRTRFSARTEYGNNSIMKPVEWARRHNLRLSPDGSTFWDSDSVSVERQFAALTRYQFQDQPYPGKIFDHVNSLFDPGQYVTNTVSLGFNSGTTTWLATASQHHTAGVVDENDGYNRYDFRLNLDHRVRNDLSVSMSAFHMRGKTEEMFDDVFFDFIHQAPDVDLRQPDPDGTKYVFQPDPVGIRANPLYQIVTQDRWTHRSRTLASMDLRYNPVSWLSLVANGSYDRGDIREEVFIPRGVKTPEGPTGDIGSASRESRMSNGLNASAGLTLARDFGALRTRSSARMLMEREDNEEVTAEADDATVGGVPDLDAFAILQNGSNTEAIRSLGYYLTTDLDYGDRYIVSLLARRDGSSLFGQEERWHWYYRASGAWRVAAESWWPFAESVNEFKLHYSRGTAGGRPGFADRFETFGVGTNGLTLGTLGNIFLKPEKTTEQEFGVDVVALGKYSLSIAHARQRTVDQLIRVPLPAIFGFADQWQNAGTIDGQTWEGTLEARLLERDGLRWSMNLIADRSRNKIVEYDRPCHMDDTTPGPDLGRRCAGEVLGQMWGQKLWKSHADLPAVHASSHDAFDVNDDGLLVPVGVGHTWRDGVKDTLWHEDVVIDGRTYKWGMPQRVLDENGQPALLRMGDANPDLNWGVSSQLRIGRVNLYALVGGQIGGDVYNSTKQRMYQYARNREIDQDGKPEERKKPAGYYTGSLYNANTVVDWFVEDASYTKLRELSVRYNLTPSQFGFLDRIGISNMWLSAVGRNLFVITGYSGYDPEVGSVLSRVDNFGYPTYRTLTFSVDVEF